MTRRGALLYGFLKYFGGPRRICDTSRMLRIHAQIQKDAEAMR
jgi:hypothetical protein